MEGKKEQRMHAQLEVACVVNVAKQALQTHGAHRQDKEKRQSPMTQRNDEGSGLAHQRSSKRSIQFPTTLPKPTR